MNRYLPSCLIGLLVSPVALGNGYQNLHQSAVGLGTAYAANGTGIDDISAIYSNPASLGRFEGLNASAAGIIILPDDSFEDLSATTSTGAPVTDGTPQVPTQFLDTSYSGYWYLSYELTNRSHLGLAFNSPWATKSDYTSTAASRYTATQTDLTAYNMAPMYSYKASDTLTVAGALNLQFYDSLFSTNLPLNPDNPDLDTDLDATFDGDDFEVGFTLGLEWQANERLRFGASYRSAIEHDFEGDVILSGPSASLDGAAAAGIASRGSASYEISTPWMLQLGTHAQLTNSLEFYGSATLTGWSEFKDTVIETNNGLGTLRVKNGWKDAWYIAAGLGYQFSPKTKLFGGVAYDETPTQDEIRNPRAPNADRVYVGLGVSHRFRPSTTVKIGYAHTFFDDAPIALTADNNPGRGTLNGNIKIDADIFMLQLIHRF